MEKKKSIGIIIFGIYLILLIGLNSFGQIKMIKHVPKTVSYFIDHPNLLEKFPHVKGLLVQTAIDVVGAIILVCVMPIACIFIFRYNNHARKVVIVSCVILLAILIIQFVRTCLVYMQFEQDASLQESIRRYVKYDLQFFLDNKASYIQISLARVLLYLVPIYYLTRPKVKEQFK